MTPLRLPPRLVRGALLVFAALASVATSTWNPPLEFGYQVDLITRSSAAYAVRAVNGPEGGFEAVIVTVWQQWDRGFAQPSPDGGIPEEPSGLRIAVMGTQPTRQDLDALAEGLLPEGARLFSRIGGGGFETRFQEEMPVSETPVYLLFHLERGGTVLDVNLLPRCEEDCGQLLMEDLTGELP